MLLIMKFHFIWLDNFSVFGEFVSFVLEFSHFFLLVIKIREKRENSNFPCSTFVIALLTHEKINKFFNKNVNELQVRVNFKRQIPSAQLSSTSDFVEKFSFCFVKVFRDFRCPGNGKLFVRVEKSGRTWTEIVFNYLSRNYCWTLNCISRLLCSFCDFGRVNFVQWPNCRHLLSFSWVFFRVN